MLGLALRGSARFEVVLRQENRYRPTLNTRGPAAIPQLTSRFLADRNSLYA